MADKLTFDFTNMTESAVGEHGIPDSMIDEYRGKATAIQADMAGRRKDGKLPFRDLPYAGIDDIVAFAADARQRFDTFVNVGIGGSALGAQALFSALNHPFHNQLDTDHRDGMRLFFTDNIDPDYLHGLFDVLNPKTTLFNIITKSGSTAETMGTFLLVKSFLERAVGAHWPKHMVMTTDPARGDLRRIADADGMTSFPVPDGVGGRFSVLCPVGLLPAACAGIDVRDFLAGAAAMDKRLESADVLDNPAYLYALYQYLLNVKRGKPISVMMPYATGLYATADWFRQLWAESLGKKLDLDGNTVNVGPTPVKALGVTDQHSQVQLYAEGPYDKSFTFLSVKKFAHDTQMEKSYTDYSSLEYLGGRNMAELIDAERRGTVYALTQSRRPNMTVTFPSVTAHAMGEFMYAFAVATVFSGGLYHINPLDQPGVEGGKVATYALMGRQGYGDRADEINRGLTSDPDHVK